MVDPKGGRFLLLLPIQGLLIGLWLVQEVFGPLAVGLCSDKGGLCVPLLHQAEGDVHMPHEGGQGQWSLDFVSLGLWRSLGGNAVARGLVLNQEPDDVQVTSARVGFARGWQRMIRIVWSQMFV